MSPAFQTNTLNNIQSISHFDEKGKVKTGKKSENRLKTDRNYSCVVNICGRKAGKKFLSQNSGGQIARECDTIRLDGANTVAKEKQRLPPVHPQAQHRFDGGLEMDPGRRAAAAQNLQMMYCYFDPDGSVFTNNSTRQDMGKKQPVRCRDCKHYHPGFTCDLMQKPIMSGDDWFCKDGERK